MLAIYFALADNLRNIKSKTSKHRKRRVVIAVRNDSKSTVEQLLGLSQIRDAVMRRIFFAIANLLAKSKTNSNNILSSTAILQHSRTLTRAEE